MPRRNLAKRRAINGLECNNPGQRTTIAAHGFSRAGLPLISCAQPIFEAGLPEQVNLEMHVRSFG